MAVFGCLDRQCRVDGSPSHAASSEDPMECEQCGLVLGRHVDLLSSQVPHVRRLAEQFSSLSVAGLRQQVVGSLAICKHALQAAVVFDHDMQRADDALPDFGDLFEFRERVSDALNVLAAVESLVQRQLDAIGTHDIDRRGQRSDHNDQLLGAAHAPTSSDIIVIED